MLKPGQLNFGSTGLGSGPHYGAALFNLAADITAVHVPYRGSPESLTDLMAGRVHYVLSPVLAASPLIKGGRLLALGVTTVQRAPALPDVPTIAEAGLAGFEYQGWYGLLAPGKTPRKIINLLSREIGRIVELPEIKERIASQGANAKRSTPEEFDKLVHEEIKTAPRCGSLPASKLNERTACRQKVRATAYSARRWEKAISSLVMNSSSTALPSALAFRAR